jgi:hypothetical protein
MIDILSPRQNKFGFYQVGDFRTYSKIEAAEQQVKTGQKMHWNFNQEVYSSYDWTVEPTESLSELYRQRAQQLRDQYDHLVLWYSGGADSATILSTFIDNDIKLDEVASYINYEATSDKFNYLNGEIFHVAVPTIKQAKEKQPWIEHTIIDITKATLDVFQEKSAKFDWIYQVNNYVNPNTVSRRDIKLKIPHWVKLFDAGKKVGFIYGIDKPRVIGLNGKYYAKFVDMLDVAVSAECQMANRAWEFNELFYWEPTNPKIVIKQSHVIKNYLKLATPTSKYITDDQKLAGTVSTSINAKMHWLTMSGLHTLIYPGWYPVPYQSKPPSLVFTLRDTWFFDLPDSEPAKYSWRVGLEHRWKTAPDFLKRDTSDISKGFKNTSSIPYYLGT